MKALVLAAGLGTRLRPYTALTPKPLFTLDGRPLLARIIDQLIAGGARTVVVNTHHLADQIHAFLRQASFAARIIVRHEPEILGTGGAIRNTADVWGTEPFMVVNSDVATDIDFAEVYRFHCAHPHPASLVMCDDPAFNTVGVDRAGHVVGFTAGAPGTGEAAARHLTFTGIQVLDPAVIDFIAPRGFAHSIDAFRDMMAAGHRISTFTVTDRLWTDVGSPKRYSRTARDIMAAAVFAAGPPGSRRQSLRWAPLAGDGSDRRWYRVHRGTATAIMVDHGIRVGAPPAEADAFVNIGRHLHRRGLPVPRILRADPFAGLVFVEDRGNRHLQTHVAGLGATTDRETLYRELIDLLIRMSVEGGRGFDPAWAWQTARYDREVIVDKECRYFVEAFVQGYCGRTITFDQIAAESHLLADGILAEENVGFMHRDFQSRNILIAGGCPWIIDYQGGRLGPVQYDLASLLIDPYVALPDEMREVLLAYFLDRYRDRTGRSRDPLEAVYRLCALARNLQILGAFGFLAVRKGKTRFADYIPNALASLQVSLARIKHHAFPQIQRVAEQVARLDRRSADGGAPTLAPSSPPEGHPTGGGQP